MSTARTYLYARVSTDEQTTQNQVNEVRAAGFAIADHRIIEETISGSTAAFERPQFARLVDRMEAGDVLIVTKIDRLGRNSIDVRSTVEKLAALGVRVHCLALGGMDLTSPAGKMTMSVLGAVAEFERDLIVERTREGIKRAVAAGKTLGRKPRLNSQATKVASEMLEQARALTAEQQVAQGLTMQAIARKTGASRQTIARLRDRINAAQPAAAA